MTPDERRIAHAALGVGPWGNHNDIVIAIADALQLDPPRVESVLHRLRIRMILLRVSTTKSRGETPSFRYEKGMEWTEE
jgi:hypothetical protein